MWHAKGDVNIISCAHEYSNACSNQACSTSDRHYTCSAQALGSTSTYGIEVVVNGLKEDAAQHGTGLATLLSMFVDEGAEL